jgi:hypothetical protein
MSKQSKNRRKLQRAREVTAAHKAGQKIGRTKKLHNKVQQYPKTVLLGPGRWKWAD